MVSGVDTLSAPLNPSISSSPSSDASDAAYVAFPLDATASTSTSPSLTDAAPSRLSAFVSKLRPYRRWIIGGSLVLVILLIAAAFTLRSSGESHQQGGGGRPVTPGGSGSNPSAGIGGNSSCPQTVIETEGPYWVDEKLNRSDLASTAQGLNLAMELLVFNSTILNKCMPIVGAMVDVWHSDALGLYSDEEILKTKGKTFLRGYQLTNAEGVVNFLTVYPGMSSAPQIAPLISAPLWPCHLTLSSLCVLSSAQAGTAGAPSTSTSASACTTLRARSSTTRRHSCSSTTPSATPS